MRRTPSGRLTTWATNSRRWTLTWRLRIWTTLRCRATSTKWCKASSTSWLSRSTHWNWKPRFHPVNLETKTSNSESTRTSASRPKEEGRLFLGSGPNPTARAPHRCQTGFNLYWISKKTRSNWRLELRLRAASSHKSSTLSSWASTACSCKKLEPS